MFLMCLECLEFLEVFRMFGIFGMFGIKRIVFETNCFRAVCNQLFGGGRGACLFYVSSVFCLLVVCFYFFCFFLLASVCGAVFCSVMFCCSGPGAPEKSPGEGGSPNS